LQAINFVLVMIDATLEDNLGYDGRADLGMIPQ